MFPEGDPTSAPIQEILYWQTNTMEVSIYWIHVHVNRQQESNSICITLYCQITNCNTQAH